MCKLMKHLDRIVQDLEIAHNIKFDRSEFEPIRSIICGNVCNGSCQDHLIEKGSKE